MSQQMSTAFFFQARCTRAVGYLGTRLVALVWFLLLVAHENPWELWLTASGARRIRGSPFRPYLTLTSS